MQSRLLKGLVKNVTDDDLIGLAQQLGLGTATKLPESGATLIPQNFGQPLDAQNPQQPETMGAPQAPMQSPPESNQLINPAQASAINAQQSAAVQPIPTGGEQPAQTGISKLLSNASPSSSDIYNKIQNTNRQTVEAERGERHGVMSRAGSGLFKGIKNWMAAGMPGGIGGLVGAAATGGIGAATSKEFYANQRVNEQKGELGQEYQQAQANEKYLADKAYGEARTQTIKNDDEQNRLNAGDRAATAAERHQEFLDKQKDTKRTSFYRTNRFFDPAKATEAQKRQLAEFDETPESVGKFDFSHPVIKTVAGSTYKLNPATGAFEDSGLPKDGSKEIVEYSVKNPATGTVSKYATTSEKAAGLQQSFVNAGLQIEAANTRQTKALAQQDKQFQQRVKLDKKKFEQSKKEFETQISLRRQALDGATKARAAAVAAKDTASSQAAERAAQAAEDRAKAMDIRLLQMQTAVLNGNLDEEQEKDLLNRIDNLGIKQQ